MELKPDYSHTGVARMLKHYAQARADCVSLNHTMDPTIRGCLLVGLDIELERCEKLIPASMNGLLQPSVADMRKHYQELVAKHNSDLNQK